MAQFWLVCRLKVRDWLTDWLSEWVSDQAITRTISSELSIRDKIRFQEEDSISWLLDWRADTVAICRIIKIETFDSQLCFYISHKRQNKVPSWLSQTVQNVVFSGRMYTLIVISQLWWQCSPVWCSLQTLWMPGWQWWVLQRYVVQPELTIHMHQQPNQQYLGHWHPVVHFSVDLLWLSLLSQPKASLSITFPNFVIEKSCLGDGGDGGGVHRFLKMISNILRSRCSNLQYSWFLFV